MAITRDGELYAWGKGTAALGVADDVATPTRVLLPPSALGGAGAGGAFVRSVTGGAAHSLAATATGEVWAWGAHERGQLGLGCAALGGAAARPPTLVTSPMRGTLTNAWRSVPGHGLAAGAPLAHLDLLAAPPPSPPPPPATPPGSAALWLAPPSNHSGAEATAAVAAACRVACEADARCGGFELPPPPAGGELTSGNCSFFDGDAAAIYASAVVRAGAALHLRETVSVGGASVVAAGGEHSLVAAGLDAAGRCPRTGEPQEECGGASRGVCAYTECRCLAPWLGDGCTAKGCDDDCAAGGHGACVLTGRDAASGAAQYACVCAAGYSGASCEVPSCPEHGGLPCAGHGSCLEGAPGEAHRCACEAGWEGAACARPQCSVGSTPAGLGGCNQRGACKCRQGGVLLAECAADGTEVQECACQDGWLGPACEHACPVTASGAVCGRTEAAPTRGTCGLSADGAAAVCTCEEGLWSGAACEKPLCPSPALKEVHGD